MKSKFLHISISLIVFLLASILLVRLTAKTKYSSGVALAEEHAHDNEESEHNDHQGDEDEHNHAMPVTLEKLSEEMCEHEIGIIDCDECRYEAGVAKMDSQLSEDLLETRIVKTKTSTIYKLELTGQIQPDLTRVVEIASAGSGRVEQILKIEGDTVKKSDILAVVQSSEFGQAQAACLESQAKLDLARQTFEREKELYSQKISSQADYQAAQNEFTAAKATNAAARKKLQLFGITSKQLNESNTDDNFGQLALASPINGTVTKQNIVQGMLVDTTDSLYRIVDLSQVWVYCDVYESDLAALHEHLRSNRPLTAEIRVKAFPDTIFIGKITVIASELNSETRTVKVRLVADNSENKLKPGMFAKITIKLEDPKTSLTLPKTAVLSDEGRDFVFVRLDQDLWIRRDVTLGPAHDGSIEIMNGLKDGDIVATKGAFMFKSEVLKEKMGAGCAH